MECDWSSDVCSSDLEESDVILLDEPTNFLDVRHIEWLTKFLINYPKAFLVVSHDEGFLHDISQTVLALENGVVTRYKGDYDYYLRERTLRLEQQEKAFVSQQKFIQKTEEFIQKNIAGAVLHRIKGAGHSSCIEQSAEVNRLIGDWLKF
jgi:ATPase subunit of ABC transporter with duplicated ATPase domains